MSRLNMHLCMDYVNFVLEAPNAKTFTGELLFCGAANILWQFADPRVGVGVGVGASIR